MSFLLTDIETAPKEEKVKSLYSFNPDEVKVGNIKDPEKIKAKIEAEEAKFWAEKLEKAALNPMTAEIVAIGYQDKDGAIIGEGIPEANLLGEFWRQFEKVEYATGANTRIVGWNLLGFDIPMMVQRSRIIGVDVPSTVMNGRYWHNCLIDLMQVWVCYCHGKYESLERVAKALGVRQPREHNIEGQNFYKHLIDDKENAIQYLRDDLQEEYEIAKRILND